MFGILVPPAGAHGAGAGVFGFLSTCEARALQLAYRLCCANVVAARWLDTETRIAGSAAAWRACFPVARAANVRGARGPHGCRASRSRARPTCGGRADLTDADFAHLAGVKTLNMERCTGVSNAGLADLTGIHTLDTRVCLGITDAGLAHLTGIHTLDMGVCYRITDAGLAHHTGIHTMNMGSPGSPTRSLRTSSVSTRWEWRGAQGSRTRASRTSAASTY